MSTAANLDTRPAKVLRFPVHCPLSTAVVAAAAATYGVPEATIWGRKRTPTVMAARQASMWALRQASWAYPSIARTFGRAHQSAMWAVRRVEKVNGRDPYSLARNLGILEAVGLSYSRAACGRFVGVSSGSREGDFLQHDRRPTDICCRKTCARRRSEHGR